MSQRVGLYGGSFDPIHHGHLIVARAIAEKLDLERIILLPTATPPHKDGESLADPTHRARMVELAAEDESLFEFNDFDLTRSGPSYTIDTVAFFQERLGKHAVLHWIIGADSLVELTGWHRISALIDYCRVVTAGRPGWERINWSALRATLSEEHVRKLRDGVVDTPRLDISSTDIRCRVHDGRSIRYLVPNSVRRYIDEHALYQDVT